MLTNNSTTSSECSLPNERTAASRDQTDSDNRLAIAYAREVKFSQPQQLTQPQCENNAELPDGSDTHPIHRREPRFYSGFGKHTVKHKESSGEYKKERTTRVTAQCVGLMDFIQTEVYAKPEDPSPELTATLSILLKSRSSEDTIRTILSSVVTIDSLCVRLLSLGHEERLDDRSDHSAYFKSKISNRLSKLMDIVKTYDFLSKNVNSVVEAYNSLKLESDAHYELLRRGLFLSEEMGEVVYGLGSQYLKVQLAIGKVINDPDTEIVRIPTLLKSFVLSSLMSFECMIECRLRDHDAIRKIAYRKPGKKMTPRKYSGIKHAGQLKIKEPRLEQSQINHSLLNLCRAIATVELFGRLKARTKLDILDQSRERLFELIDRFVTETHVTVAEILLIPGSSTIEKYLVYSELLHATEAAPKKHIEARKAVMEIITHMASLSQAAAIAEDTDNNEAGTEDYLHFSASDIQLAKSWRRFPLSDHIMLGVESACKGLIRDIEQKTIKDLCSQDLNAEKLLEDLYYLDLWIKDLRATGLINITTLSTCPSFRQLMPLRKALHELIETHQATLDAAFEEASKHIIPGNPETAAGLSSPSDPALFSNPDLLKTINHFLFANGELTISEWNEQQGKRFVTLLSKKHWSPHSRSLTAFIECCQHEKKINEHIQNIRLTFADKTYVTTIHATILTPQLTENKINRFHEEITQYVKLTKKIQSEWQEWSKKITKIKPKSGDEYGELKLKLFTASQNALHFSTEQQRHLSVGLDLMLEKRRHVLTTDFPKLYRLEKQIYDTSANKIKSQIKSAKRVSKNNNNPSRLQPETSQQPQPGKAGFFITTPLPGLGFTLDNSPPLNSLKIPCLESAPDSGLTGKQLLDQVSQQLHVQVAAYLTANNDFYSPPPGEPANTGCSPNQMSFANFLASTRIRLDDATIIKQRNFFHQHITSQVGSLIHGETPVVYMGSRAFQTQLQSLWGAKVLEDLDKLPLPTIDPAITRRATTPRDTDLLIVDKAQMATVKQKMYDTLLSTARNSPDLPSDYELTTTDERIEIFYGAKCLTCNLILHKKGFLSPKYWIYVVDLVTCVDDDASALHAFDSPALPSGETTHCRRIDVIIMDELKLAVAMAAGPPRGLIAMTRIGFLAALETTNPKLDNRARLALIYALDTVHHHFPDPVFAQLVADLRSRTFTVVDHEGQLLGVKQLDTPGKTSKLHDK